MNRRINVERLILLFLVVFTIFLVISHIQVTADLNQKFLKQKTKIEELETNVYKIQQEKTFLEEKINLLNQAFEDIKK